MAHHKINLTEDIIPMHKIIGHRISIPRRHNHQNRNEHHHVLTKSESYGTTIFNMIPYQILILGLLTGTNAIDTESVSYEINLMETHRMRSKHHRSFNEPTMKPRYTPVERPDHN